MLSQRSELKKRTYREKDFIDIRQFYRDDEGKFQPTPKGITIPPERLPELITALETLRAYP